MPRRTYDLEKTTLLKLDILDLTSDLSKSEIVDVAIDILFTTLKNSEKISEKEFTITAEEIESLQNIVTSIFTSSIAAKFPYVKS